MIEKLLENGLLSKKKLLLEHYKKIELTDSQVLIILIIMHINDQTKKMTTPSLLARYMNLSADEIENELQILVEKDLIEIKPRYIDFAKLFKKIALISWEFHNIQTNKDFFDQLENKLSSKLNDNQKLELSKLINQAVIKNQVLELADELKPANFDNLIQTLYQELNLNNQTINHLSQFDWLDD
ncbi:DnaD family protein [Mycoplasma putrefaciens]|uniref:DnaD N-terminal domain-containing protein n=1 Tax=Mycoplasma putrefaciens (strain ATCC 15718 / NCTC 10155 / C30 KS-1 / KS-1) TaxID=743965 RepID=A0A7U4E9D0_MYCPK|nr:DnaD family protein [Mycoplasma putrefaciens]AEM68779.1 uncharacterized protein MPUT_0404 [Mycoplasma putrefaciens KS1]